MRRFPLRTFIACALSAGVLVTLSTSVPYAAEGERSIADMLKAARRGKATEKAQVLKKIEQGDALYSQKKFEAARKLYQQVEGSDADIGYDKRRHLRKRLEGMDREIEQAQAAAVMDKYDEAVRLYRQGDFQKAKPLFREVRGSGVKLNFLKERELARYLDRIDDDITVAAAKRGAVADALSTLEGQLRPIKDLPGSQLISTDAAARIEACDGLLAKIEDDRSWAGAELLAKLEAQKTVLRGVTQRRQDFISSAQRDAETKYERAESLAKQDQHEEALKLLAEVEKAPPEVAKEWIVKAQELRGEVQEEMAHRDQAKRVRLAKRASLEKRLAEGRKHLESGDYDAARAAFREVAAGGDVLDKQVVALARVLAGEAVRKKEEARQDLSQLREVVSQYYDEGRDLAKAEKYEQAKAKFDAVEKLLTDHPEFDRPDKLATYVRAVQSALDEKARVMAARAADTRSIDETMAKAKGAVDAGKFEDARGMLAELVRRVREEELDMPEAQRSRLEKMVQEANAGWAAQREGTLRQEVAAIEKRRIEAQAKATQEDRARLLLDEALAKEEIRREQHRVEAQHRVSVAKKLIQGAQYAEAIVELEQAAKLDPENVDAQKLLVQTRALMETGVTGIARFTQEVSIEEEVRISQAKLNLANHIADANRLMAQLKYAEAIEKIEYALSIVSYLEKQIDVAADRAMVERLLAKTKALKKEADEHEVAEEKDSARLALEDYARRDQERVREKKSELFTQGWKHIREEDYDQALEVAEKILSIDPEDQSAKILKDKAFEESHAKRLRRLGKQLKREVKRNVEDTLERTIPHSELVTYVDKETWEDVILQRRPAESFPGAEEESAGTLKIKESLTKPVTLDFAETPVTDVVTFLQDFTGVNMILDPNAVEDGGPSITLKVEDMPLEKALGFILQFAQLDYEIRGDALFISDEEGLSDYDLRTYDVRDLLISIQDKESTEFNMAAGGGGAGGGGGGGLSGLGGGSDEEEGLDITERATDLLTLITRIIEPQSWRYVFVSGGGEEGDTEIELDVESEDAKGGLVYREGDLIVVQTPKVHAMIGEMLESLRETKNMQVNIEARFVTVSDTFAERFGVQIDRFISDPALESSDPTDPFAPPRARSLISGPTTGYVFPQFAGNPFLITPTSQASVPQPFIGTETAPGATGLNLRFAYLGSRFVEGFIRAAQESDEGEVLTCPRLTLTNTQRGNLMVATSQPYVASYTATSNIAIPTVNYVFDGIMFDVRPIVSADRRYVFLELAPAISRIIRIEEFVFSTSVGANTTASTVSSTIQQPVTEIQTVAVTVSVPDRGTVLIGGLSARNKSEVSRGVPILSKIPVIKRIFQSDRESLNRNNLLIVVKPTIIIQEEEEAKM